MKVSKWSNMPKVVNDKSENGRKVIEVTEIGDKRKEVESALQYAFNKNTSKVRSGLIATDLADPNPNHPHYQTYKENAEKMDITVMSSGDGKRPLTKVIIN